MSSEKLNDRQREEFANIVAMMRDAWDGKAQVMAEEHVAELILARDSRPTPDAGLSTADRIALAMLDDPGVFRDPLIGLRLPEFPLHVDIAKPDLCSEDGEWCADLSPAVAARCREKWEELRGGK